MTAARLEVLCRGLTRGEDEVWSAVAPAPTAGTSEQDAERALRAQMAAQPHDDYIRDISRHHSVPVMDHEVERFLARVPKGGAIVDVGGCWGWHWRRLALQRPDVCVVIVDFVRENLWHARRVLAPLLGRQVALVHGDATDLPFPDGSFDAFWTVQAFQHIPQFPLACQEAYRVMTRGPFACYSLHAAPLVRAVYRLFGRPFHQQGQLGTAFYLARASAEQRRVVAEVFHGKASVRYSECLFHPDLRLTFTGGEHSLLGKLDAQLSDWPMLARLVARQCAFEATKGA